MSVKAMNWAFEQQVSPVGRKFVLVCIADHADVRGFCYPGQKRLCEMTGLARSNLHGHIVALEEQGFIKRYERRNRKGFKTSDGYMLLAPAGLFESFDGDMRDVFGEHINEKGDDPSDFD